LGKYIINIADIEEIQNIIFDDFDAFFFSIKLYELYINKPVIITNNGLYFVMLAKNADPTDPRPRAANNRPLVQHIAAKKALNIDKILKIFSFISYLLNLL